MDKLEENQTFNYADSFVQTIKEYDDISDASKEDYQRMQQHQQDEKEKLEIS